MTFMMASSVFGLCRVEYPKQCR